MQLLPKLARSLVISGAAHLAAGCASAAMMLGAVAVEWSAAQGGRDTKLMDVLLAMGGAGVSQYGWLGSIFAVPLLWRTELRKSVPATATATVGAAALSGFLLAPQGLEGAWLCILITLFAGVLAMLLSRTKWPLAPANLHARRTRRPMSTPAGGGSPT